jgi:hypothetical protein
VKFCFTSSIFKFGVLIHEDLSTEDITMLRTSAFRHIVLLFGMLASGLTALSSSTVNAASTYNAYAPPNFYGTWTQVGAHAGAASFNIKAEPIGNTVIVGEVKYFPYANKPAIVVPFRGGVNIRTCPCYGTVQVHFKGIPTGSAVKVTVN